MKISEGGLNLIKQFEGFSEKPYKDAVGLWTIGYGTLIDTPEEKALVSVTKEQATALIVHDLAPVEANLNKVLPKTITQNQYDALCSFCYNLGFTNFKTSTLLKKIIANPNDKSIPAEFLKWSRAGGRVLKGLIDRRAAEGKLYIS